MFLLTALLFLLLLLLLLVLFYFGIWCKRQSFNVYDKTIDFFPQKLFLITSFRRRMKNRMVASFQQENPQSSTHTRERRVSESEERFQENDYEVVNKHRTPQAKTQYKSAVC